jgi:hypothetical protein
MARVSTCGWDTGNAAEFRDGSLSSANQSADSSTKRTGGYSLKVLQPGTAINVYWFAATGISTFGKVYGRVWINFNANPAAAAKIIALSTAAGSAAVTYGINLTTSGTLQVLSNGSGVGAASAVLATSTWHLVEFSFDYQSTTFGYELKVNGTTVSSSTASITGTSGNIGAIGLGSPTAAATGFQCNFDDFKLNDTSGSDETGYPNAGDLVLLLPTADSSVGAGWQKPGGATTNLNTAVDNIPCPAVADTTSVANAEKQIRNATTLNSYAVTMQTYTAAGITGTVLGVIPFACIGAPSTASFKTGNIALSNPTIGSTSFGNWTAAGVAQATFPAGWTYKAKAYLANPSPTLGTAPVVTLGTSAGTTTIVTSIAFIGVYVEWVAGTTYNDTLTESLTAATALANICTFPNAFSETVVGADSETSVATFPNTLSESIVSGYSLANAATFPNTLSESVTGADSVASVATFPNTLSETSLVLLVNICTFPNDLTESALCADGFATIVTWVSSLSEAVSAADNVDAANTIGVSLSEELAANDNFIGSLLTSSEFSESLTAADSVDVVATYETVVSEEAFADFSLDLQAIYSADYSELLTADVIFLARSSAASPDHNSRTTLDISVGRAIVDLPDRHVVLDIGVSYEAVLWPWSVTHPGTAGTGTGGSGGTTYSVDYNETLTADDDFSTPGDAGGTIHAVEYGELITANVDFTGTGGTGGVGGTIHSADYSETLTANAVFASRATHPAQYSAPLTANVVFADSVGSTGDTATYTRPPVGSNGLAPRTGLLWNGHSWGNNSGQTWNLNVPYAIGLGDGALRIELHDTTNDHGLNDPSEKRRSEIGSADTFKNGIEYWFAYSFKTHITNLKAGLSIRTMQVHWPSGASPAAGCSLVFANGGLAFRVSRKTDSTDNIEMATVACTMDVPHDVVMNFKLGGAGFLRVWIDGVQIVNYTGQVGSTIENGYSLRLGNYGAISGMASVTEYKNIATFPRSDDLTSRITAPPQF